ncbi:hypothetical protein WJX72_005857 [[Myrmecia] bisecta]|uniref:Uncharacterized protein n=1 Tax=[Myrmecia] bisecta TaxID=41462 RepID=A0AAW1QQZ8_9CHLO
MQKPVPATASQNEPKKAKLRTLHEDLSDMIDRTLLQGRYKPQGRGRSPISRAASVTGWAHVLLGLLLLLAPTKACELLFGSTAPVVDLARAVGLALALLGYLYLLAARHEADWVVYAGVLAHIGPLPFTLICFWLLGKLSPNFVATHILWDGMVTAVGYGGYRKLKLHSTAAAGKKE